MSKPAETHVTPGYIQRQLDAPDPPLVVELPTGISTQAMSVLVQLREAYQKLCILQGDKAGAVGNIVGTAHEGIRSEIEGAETAARQQELLNRIFGGDTAREGVMRDLDFRQRVTRALVQYATERARGLKPATAEKVPAAQRVRPPLSRKDLPVYICVLLAEYIDLQVDPFAWAADAPNRPMGDGDPYGPTVVRDRPVLGRASQN